MQSPASYLLVSAQPPMGAGNPTQALVGDCKTRNRLQSWFLHFLRIGKPYGSFCEALHTPTSLLPIMVSEAHVSLLAVAQSWGLCGCLPQLPTTLEGKERVYQAGAL